MEGEQVAFAEEGQPGQDLKLIAGGDMDDCFREGFYRERAVNRALSAASRE